MEHLAELGGVIPTGKFGVAGDEDGHASNGLRRLAIGSGDVVQALPLVGDECRVMGMKEFEEREKVVMWNGFDRWEYKVGMKMGMNGLVGVNQTG